MSFKHSIFGATTALCVAAPVLAHDGARVWIDQVNGTIATFTSNNDLNPVSYAPGQVFSADLEDLGVFTTEFPGYEVKRAGAAVNSGTSFGFRLAGPLLVLNPAGTMLLESQEQFGSPGPAPQMAVSLGSEFRVTNATVQDGFNFFNYAGSGDHAHLSYTLLGNGVAPVNGPDGAYVLPMQLTAANLARSDWYFIVLGKNATGTQMNQARGLAQRMADALPGDANFSGTVDIDDFGILAANFNTGGRWWRHGDFNFDGSVNIDDFGALAANFNQSSPPAAMARLSVPEPVGVGAGLAFLVLGWGRRCRPSLRSTPL